MSGRLLGLTQVEGKPQVAWEYVTNSQVPGPVVLGADGNLRIHCGDGFLHCVSSGGRQIWAPALVGEPLGWAAPLVDEQGNTWIHAYDGGLIKIDPEGRVPTQRFFRSRQRFDSTSVLCDGVLFTGSEDGYIFAIDLRGARGVNLWDHTAGQGAVGWFVNTAPAVGQDLVVVAAGDGCLHGFAFDGKPAWKTKMPGQMMGSPVIDKFGHVYVGVTQSRRGQQSSGALVSVDANSRKIRWEYASAAVESTPVIGDDDVLYFGDNAGTIHAVDSRGQVQWKAKVESPVRSAGTILGPQRVAFGLDNETLIVLRCSSNSLADGGWPKLRGTLAQGGSSAAGSEEP